MSRFKRFSAIIQDGKLSTWIVRVRAGDADAARAKAVALAEQEAMTVYPDAEVRKLMTRDKFSVSHLFQGHVRDAG